MSFKPLDSRQIINRATLQELYPWIGGQTLDVLMASINFDLTPPLKVDATSTPSLVVNVGSSIVANAESNRNKSISFIDNLIPNSPPGTVTFPSSSGGNIVASTGGTTPLVIPVGDYAQVLLALDKTGNIIVTVGTPSAVLSTALVPPPTTNTLPFAYVTVQNIGGVIQNIAQDNIFQLQLGGGGSGGGGGGALWVANEVSIASGATSISVSFSSPQPDTSYVVFGMMENVLDPHPEFQQIELIDKSVNGFIFAWNHPLDTANYILSYIVPPKTMFAEEVPISLGANTLSSSLSVPEGSSAYGVIAMLQNIVDTNPQFQTTVVGSNTTSATNFSWNVPTDTSNYVMAYMIGATQQVAIGNGVTSVVAPLPVDYGITNYAVIATMQNLTDPNPQFQPIVVRAKTTDSVTFGWNVNTDTANYILTYYTISYSTGGGGGGGGGVSTLNTLTGDVTLAAGSGINITPFGNILTISATATPLTFADSLSNIGGTVTLVNDSPAPGNSMYYGTNGSGILGYYALSGSSAQVLGQSLIAGVTFASQTSYAVRAAIVDSSETAGTVYKADNNASVTDNFWVIGFAMSPAGVAPSGSIFVTYDGLFTLGSSDTPFLSTDVGHPVFLGTSGGWTTTAPVTSGTAVVKIGMVYSTTQILVETQFMGVI